MPIANKASFARQTCPNCNADLHEPHSLISAETGARARIFTHELLSKPSLLINRSVRGLTTERKGTWLCNACKQPLPFSAETHTIVPDPDI